MTGIFKFLSFDFWTANSSHCVESLEYITILLDTFLCISTYNSKGISFAPGLFSLKSKCHYISFDFPQRKVRDICVGGDMQRGRIVATVYGGLTVLCAWRKGEGDKF